MDPALIVSDIAAFISLFALGRQLRRAWWVRPVVLVSARIVWRSFDHGAHWDLWMGVANIGERPVTVMDWGWIIGHNENGPVIFRHTPVAGQTGMPMRFEPHGVVTRYASRISGAQWLESVHYEAAKLSRSPKRWRRDRHAGATRWELSRNFAPDRYIARTD